MGQHFSQMLFRTIKRNVIKTHGAWQGSVVTEWSWDTATCC